VENNFRGKNLIIVGGVPRSGTTLLQNMLDSHPDIHGLPEFKILIPIMRLRNMLRVWITGGMIDPGLCSGEDLDRNFREFVNMFLAPHFAEHKCKYLSEKTPDNIFVFSELVELFPEARFILVVRDPRAVISSLLQVRKKVLMQSKDAEIIKYTENFNGVRAAIKFNRQLLESGFNAVKKAPEENLVVVYRQLVLNPEAETKRICEFLKINWSERMQHPGQFKHPGERSMTSEKAAPWYDAKKYNRDPEVKEIEKWKSQLTLAEQIRIAKAFQGHADLENLGYDFSLDYLSTGQRWRGQIQSKLRESIGSTRKAVKRFINRII